MKPFQERVVEERKALDEKRLALGKFIDGEMFKALSNDEQGRLIEQAFVMFLYSRVLGQRIDAFDQ